MMGGAGLDATVRLAQAGDPAAFGELYRAHVGRIHALCLRLEGDDVRAAELTQDVFVRAWRRIRTYRGESAFGTWLHRIGINTVLGDRRSAFRRSRHLMLTDNLEHLEHATPPVGTLRMDLEAAIARLPAGARTVFVLHDIEGYTHDEIASAAGIAAGTSKAQLFRARRLLREMLT